MLHVHSFRDMKKAPAGKRKLIAALKCDSLVLRAHRSARSPCSPHDSVKSETHQMHQFRRSRPFSALSVFTLGLLGLTGGAHAQTAPTLEMRSLAATCASCHGTEGNAVQGETMVRLAGLPKDYFVLQMLAFREGKRPATVMHQISKGYTPEQIEALATYFAAKK
jgi:cytochrome subunit of sulfide dehydrogenase